LAGGDVLERDEDGHHLDHRSRRPAETLLFREEELTGLGVGEDRRAIGRGRRERQRGALGAGLTGEPENEAEADGGGGTERERTSERRGDAGRDPCTASARTPAPK